ncbi:MAG TPA: alpha-amylase/4-alpha-glucanotransferase domain-containing protein [Gemmatimonadales bacterium]
MTRPVLFAFGLHLHQPVGNFDHVFSSHLEDVYRPLLRELGRDHLLPVTLHLSGPLLEWLEEHAADYLDQLGAVVASGQVELLSSGYDEPILAALAREDRLEQIGRMRETLRRRFGVEATGLWLTERVWEPDLAADLSDAGVAYVLVDDRHFLVSGFEREALHLPFRTEAHGRRLSVFPIDERLRYLVPFRPAAEFASYIRELGQAGQRLAVLADDGEKFGGWPGTRAWVYERGWLHSWAETIAELRAAEELQLVTFREALDTLPSGGLAYLPTSSYREMEGWALPPQRAQRLLALETELGTRIQSTEGTLVRGSHWRHFLVKYSEANAMHKKAAALSRLCRERGDPPGARRAIGRAQCNDAYWHGVFGGLYLPHLRHAVWRNLAEAERILRQGEPLGWELLDLDADGHDELWLHSEACSVVVSPARGGRVEELTRFDTGINHGAVLTRRREAYHEQPLAPPPGAAAAPEAAPSIHDLERALVLEKLPPVDLESRVLLAERIIAGETTGEAYAAGSLAPIRSWHQPFDLMVAPTGDGTGDVLVRLCGPGLDKELTLSPDGRLAVRYRWDPAIAPAGADFVAEVSLAAPLALNAPGAELWEYDVETVAKSEKGFDRTIQGRAVVLRWPVAQGNAELQLGWSVVAPTPPG